MELRLKDKTAVITGASQGIGRAIAMQLAAEGCHLHLAARSAADLEQLAAELSRQHNVRVETHALDLAQTDNQDRLAEHCLQAEILVNNAGNIPSGELDSFTDASWRAGWELKVFAYINLTRQFYTAMKARRHGVIVNIIGAAGIRPDASYIAGTTGNAALIAFTKALGARSVDFGVRVVGINPSLTDTPRAQRILAFKRQQHPANPDFEREFLAKLPFGRLCAPEEIAAMVAFLASQQAAYLSGTVVDVDGGLTARP